MNNISDDFNFDDVKAFFDNPYSKFFIEMTNDVIRMNVTTLIASCDYAKFIAGEDGVVNGNELAGKVSDASGNMMRFAELTQAMGGSLGESYYFKIDQLLADIVSGCSQQLNGRIKVTVNGETGCTVYADGRAVKYIILSAVRTIIMHSGGDIPEIELVTEKKGDDITVTVRSSSPAPEAVPGTFSGNVFLTNKMIAFRFGGSFDMEPYGYILTLPAAEADERELFRSRTRHGDEGKYSTFSIMLGGLDKYFQPGGSPDEEG